MKNLAIRVTTFDIDFSWYSNWTLVMAATSHTYPVTPFSTIDIPKSWQRTIWSKARYCKHYPEGPKDPKVILKTVRILKILRFILPIICHVPGS